MDRKNVLQIIGIAISGTLLILFIYNFFLSPPNITLVISAIGNAKVETDYSKITFLSYFLEKPQPVTFLVKIVNDGGNSAKNFHLVMDFQPRDPDWVDPGIVPVETPNYLPCTLGLANECFIGIIPKGESVIVGFAGSVYYPIYVEVLEQNPRIVLSYWYDGTEKKEQTVEIRLG